jgi:hypothetical protein
VLEKTRIRARLGGKRQLLRFRYPRVSRVRLTTWALIAWSSFGAAAAYWGYRSVMASCPAFDDFAGCFEPPYRFAAGVFFVFWGTVEAALVGAWLVQRVNRR